MAAIRWNARVRRYLPLSLRSDRSVYLKSPVMSEVCAYHEAGHALVAYLHGAWVERIDIDPEWDDDYLRSDGELEVRWPPAARRGSSLALAEIKVALSGPAAEMVYTGNPFHPLFVQEWAFDWQIAWDRSGSLNLGSDMKRMKLLEQSVREAYLLFRRDQVWQATASLADELLAHERLDGEEIHEVLRRWI